jgi:hypothetical protein
MLKVFSKFLDINQKELDRLSKLTLRVIIGQDGFITPIE